MTRAGELVLSCLFLDPTPERLAQLRSAARDVEDWGPVPLLLESHGVLVLARRNLGLAGVELPPATGTVLGEREAVLREIDLRFRLTLERFLHETARDGIDVTLLKGASLALDLYPDSALRSQGDLDVLVHPQDVRTALHAAARCGLFVGLGALPVWWYRLAHFHLKLVPENPLLREVELHWALQHPAELVTVPLEELLARRRPVEMPDARAWTLDPLDRLLHLVTHLVRHLGEAPAETGRAALVAVASTPAHPLRLRWILDVRSEVERLHGATDPIALAARARVWNADVALASTLRWLRGGLGFTLEADAWIGRLLDALGDGTPVSRAHRKSSPRRGQPTLIPALDLRSTSLHRLPRWIVPPRYYFERRVVPGQRPAPLFLRRTLHGSSVLARGCASLAVLPFAIVGAVLSRPSRQRARRALRRPARVLDVAAAHLLAAKREGGKRP